MLIKHRILSFSHTVLTIVFPYLKGFINYIQKFYILKKNFKVPKKIDWKEFVINFKIM